MKQGARVGIDTLRAVNPVFSHLRQKYEVKTIQQSDISI
jgi:hypothetical protein